MRKQHDNRQLTVGSLFAGIGGIDLGLERAGMRVVWQAENNPFCQQILRERFPGATIYGSVRRKRSYPHVDVLAGGFPCQPISGAGLRLFEDDPRWMWPEFLSVIRQVRPKWVLIENVEGLRTRGLGLVLKGLAESGYDAEWDCLPAAAFGAPHRRYRFFIVAYPQGARLSRPCIYRQQTGDGHVADVGKSSSNGDDSGRDKQGLYAVEREGIFLFAGSSGRCNGSRRIEGIGVGESARFPRVADKRKVAPVPREISVARAGWWVSEPDVGRVVYGVPARVDRITALGNAVVPQVAEWVGRQIVRAHNEMTAREVADASA